MVSYFGYTFQGLDMPARIAMCEEVLTSALMWLLTLNNIHSYGEACQIAQRVNLDALLSDPVMIHQFDMAGRPPFTFTGLIKEAHFVPPANTVFGKHLFHSWIDAIAAVGVGHPNDGSHYWHGSSRKWAVREDSKRGKRGPESAVWRETELFRRQGVGGFASAPGAEDEFAGGDDPIGSYGQFGGGGGGGDCRTRGVGDIDDVFADRLFKHTARLQVISLTHPQPLTLTLTLTPTRTPTPHRSPLTSHLSPSP